MIGAVIIVWLLSARHVDDDAFAAAP
jgi:hypothetical protein